MLNQCEGFLYDREFDQMHMCESKRWTFVPLKSLTKCSITKNEKRFINNNYELDVAK